jgi:4-hydroxy-2-oxoheptanedioate aldolase
VTRGDALVGTVLTLPGATAAELLAEPFDVVWIDLEHGALGPLDAQEVMLGAQASGAYALVRIPAHSLSLMTTMLDAGADGVVLAGVDDADIAAAATERVVHPPAGTRGWGPRRLTLRHRSAGGCTPRASVWVQIETGAGVERAADIAAVEGVDAVIVGTADLSFSLGTPLDTGTPDLAHAVAAVRRAAEAAGVALGIAGALDALSDGVHAGASILIHSTDARLCARAVDESAAWMRATLGPREEAQE